MPGLGVCRSRGLHQRSEREGHAHGGGLRHHESRLGDGGVHSRVPLPWEGAVPSALHLVSQKPLLQRWRVCGHAARLQVSGEGRAEFSREMEMTLDIGDTGVLVVLATLARPLAH